MTAPIRVALYVRVSTLGQTVENQLHELHAVAERHGWNIVLAFKDEGISGAKGRDKRPCLDRLLKAVSRRDLVAAGQSLGLVGSLQDLIAVLGELHGKGCDLYLHQQGINTRTFAGKAMYHMLGYLANLSGP